MKIRDLREDIQPIAMIQLSQKELGEELRKELGLRITDLIYENLDVNLDVRCRKWNVELESHPGGSVSVMLVLRDHDLPQPLLESIKDYVKKLQIDVKLDLAMSAYLNHLGS